MKKKTITLIFFGILIVIVGYFTLEISGFGKGVQNDIENAKNHFPREEFVLKNIKNGIWINSEDSLATIRIEEFKWIFEYENYKTDSTNFYNYLISEKENVSFLTLTNETDTLKYELDYLTNNDMSIIYLARGNFHHYRRID